MFTRFVGCGMKSIWPIFKTKMLLYQSKVIFDVKILFRKITHLYDLKISKVSARGMYGNKNSGP